MEQIAAGNLVTDEVKRDYKGMLLAGLEFGDDYETAKSAAWKCVSQEHGLPDGLPITEVSKLANIARYIKPKFDTKVCTKCGLTKRKSEFNHHSYTKDNLQYWCRDCQTERRKLNRQKKSSKEQMQELFQNDHVVAEEFNLSYRAVEGDVQAIYENGELTFSRVDGADFTVSDIDTIVNLREIAKATLAKNNINLEA